MAKRSRGTTSRPGQRARLERGAVPRRSTSDPVVAPRPSTLTDEEERRAAELEAQIVAAERAAEPPPTRSRERTPDGQGRVRTGTLGTRAASEYAYVVRDIRRIVLIGGSLLVFLIGLWVAQQVIGFGPL
ncbi:MAG: hypothetical protein ACXW4T_02595 [Candidatus Limnocylindrales bacterium]